MKTAGLLWKAVSALVVICAVAIATPADAKQCWPVTGDTVSLFAPPWDCTSPMGICTNGVNTGGFGGTYHFVMETMTPDPQNPGIQYFTGHSVITPDQGHGTITSFDSGRIIFTGPTTGLFSNTIQILSGTDKWVNTTGTVIVTGTADFVAGKVTATYTGSLCKEDDGNAQ